MQYFGGKFRISKKIAQYINENYSNYENYAEPFCGSCNVATKINIKHKILNDKHIYLIEMWKGLQNGWIPPESISEEQYKYIKNNLDEDEKLSGFVGFGCSFAGKWFGGYARSKKGVNVSTKYATQSKNRALNKIKTIEESNFINKDFLELNFKNTVIYCDPPYKNTTPYNKKILGEFPYNDFVKWCKVQSQNNIVIVSEYKHNMPSDAILLLEVESKTDIRGKDGNKIPTIEVLYTY